MGLDAVITAHRMNSDSLNEEWVCGLQKRGKTLSAAALFLQSILRNMVRTWRLMKKADVPLWAGSLSFSTVLSIVPLMAVTLGVFKELGGFEALMKRIEPFILSNFVEASGANVSLFIHDSIKRVQSGSIGTLGAVALLFTSTKLFLDVERAVQRIWEQTKKRAFLKRILVYWSVMFGGPLVLAIGLGVLSSKGLGLVRILPVKSISFAATFIGFLLINRFLPSSPVRWRSAVISSLLTAVGILMAQLFYARVTRDFLRYSAIYGSIASIPLFFLWLLVLWWIFLGGVALCAVLEKENL